jgi:uroporphyrinogen decarboxylase
MNSKDRVLMTLDHQETDRVPVDLGGWVTTIHKKAYQKLLTFLGYESGNCLVNDWIRQTVLPEEHILKYLDIDFRHLFPGKSSRWFFTVEDKGSSEEVVDEWGVRYRKPKDGGIYFDAVSGPLEKKELLSVDDLENIKWPDPYDSGYSDGLREKAKKIYQENMYALVGDFAWETWYERSWKIRGFENFYLDFAINPDLSVALMEKVATIHMGFLDNVLKECGEFLDIIVQGGDYGSQYGLLISPEMYRKYIKPIQKKVNDFIRNRTKAKIFYHSCGAIEPIIDDLVEIGVQILNPIQISAGNMGPELLKKRYGDNITFWGGIDTQRLLPFGDPPSVKKEVHRIKSILGKEGGYVLSAVHNIQPEVPPENIIAMYQAAVQVQ